MTLPSAGRFAGGVFVGPAGAEALDDGWSGLWATPNEGDCGCGEPADGWSGLWAPSSSGAFVGGCGCERPELEDGWSGSPRARTSAGAGARTGGGGPSFAGAIPTEGGGYDPRWTFAISLSVPNAGGLAVKGTPDTQVGGDYVPPESAGNTEASDQNTFVDEVAAEASQQFEGLYDTPAWADTVGGCATGGYTTCGDPRFDRGELVATEPGVVGATLLPLIDASLVGDWTACERAAVQMAWMLLADNLDLVQWALCVATGDPSTGDCVEDHILCNTRLQVQKRACTSAGDNLQSGAAEPFSVIETVAMLTGAPLVWGYFLEPWVGMISLCTGDVALARDAELYCSDDPNAVDCGVVHLASLLLHEMTHLCFRSIGDQPGNCQVSFLAQNYFLYGALARYPAADESKCCTAARVPGVRVMDDSWFPSAGPCIGQVDEKPRIYP